MTHHRASSQVARLRKLLEDGLPHSTPEICEKVYGAAHLGLARVPSRIHELREEGLNIHSWRDPVTPTIWHYQLKNPAPKVKLIPVEENGRIVSWRRVVESVRHDA